MPRDRVARGRFTAARSAPGIPESSTTAVDERRAEATLTVDCPDCPHSAQDHGTYGCLFGWANQVYGWGIIQGCRCAHRGVAG